MLARGGRLFSALVVLIAIFFTIPAHSVKASLTDCEASVFSHSVPGSTEHIIQFSITNNSSDPISWVQILRPSSEYTLLSSSMLGWTSSTSDDTASFTAGSVIYPNGYTQDIYLDVATGSPDSQKDWTVLASDTMSSTDAIQCSGSLSSEITEPGNNTTPIISNVDVVDIGQHSATVTWSTNEPTTAQLNYGVYDSSELSLSFPEPATNHSVVLSDLELNTSYHFQIIVWDEDNNQAQTGDNTFLTEDISVTGGGNNFGGGENSNNSSGSNSNNTSGNAKIDTSTPLTLLVPLKAKAVEKDPPKVSLEPLTQEVYTLLPTIHGSATDNEIVAGLEYSLDGGINWLPIKSVSGVGSGSVHFTFTPENLEDGDYEVLVRAIDTSSNIGKSKALSFVIDLLPPIVGGITVSNGPLLMEPGGDGVIELFEGVDHMITTSATGGPTKIDLQVKKTNSKITSQTFSLTRKNNSQLWQGLLSFKSSGVYTLVAEAIDGAGNHSEREITNILVHPAATVRDHNAKPIKGASLSVYYQPSGKNDWYLWDAESYSQTNPQKTDGQGKARLLLPAGKYYIKLQHPAYSTSTSKIFTLKKTTPISSGFILDRKFGLSLGGFDITVPSLAAQAVNTQTSTGSSTQETNILHKPVPDFSLPSTNSNNISPVDFLGKPTLLCMLSSWTPSSSAQLSELDKIASNKDISIYVMGIQDNIARLTAMHSIRKSKIIWIADKNGDLAVRFNLSSLPTNVFINRKGLVQAVDAKLLSSNEILDRLSGVDF